MDGLECLAWAVYDGVFLPGDPPTLIGYHDWKWIIAGTALRLIYQEKTLGVHCPPCTVMSQNTEWAAKEATLLEGSL